MGDKGKIKADKKTERHCAACGEAIAPGAENECPECNAVYCDQHMTFTPWSHPYVTIDTMYRTATCPHGHKITEEQD